jgi:hypothetical protein
MQIILTFQKALLYLQPVTNRKWWEAINIVQSLYTMLDAHFTSLKHWFPNRFIYTSCIKMLYSIRICSFTDIKYGHFMFDSNPHGKSQVYKQGTLWDTPFIHDDQFICGISHREKRTNCIRNEVGIGRYFHSSESFTDHRVLTSIILCSVHMGNGLLAKVLRYSFVGTGYGSFRRWMWIFKQEQNKQCTGNQVWTNS